MPIVIARNASAAPASEGQPVVRWQGVGGPWDTLDCARFKHYGIGSHHLDLLEHLHLPVGTAADLAGRPPILQWASIGSGMLILGRVLRAERACRRRHDSTATPLWTDSWSGYGHASASASGALISPRSAPCVLRRCRSARGVLGHHALAHRPHTCKQVSARPCIEGLMAPATQRLARPSSQPGLCTDVQPSTHLQCQVELEPC